MADRKERAEERARLAFGLPRRARLGAIGESLAVDFLQKLGYTILEANYRTPLGEIDIIAKERDYLVFVEVRTRSSSVFGPPFASITKRKMHKIVVNALYYLKMNKCLRAKQRIDIVSVTLLRGRSVAPEIILFRNAVSDHRHL
ncbi:MAG: YraN family protein [Candidatus Omnitrophota bacterium]